MGLIATDVGRPVGRLKLNMDTARLEQMMLEVIREAETKQFEVQDTGGSLCRLRISPYRTLDNRIDGAVLSIVETSARRAASAGKKSAPAKRPRRR